MKDDMRVVSHKASLIREGHQKLKYFQAQDEESPHHLAIGLKTQQGTKLQAKESNHRLMLWFSERVLRKVFFPLF